MSVVSDLSGRLIVSCQAAPDEPLHGIDHMLAMAKAAKQGGAVALRLEGIDCIRAIAPALGLPILGIVKRSLDGYPVYITPTLADAMAIEAAGAAIVAVDATERDRPEGGDLAGWIRLLKSNLKVPLMADVSTLEEGIVAAQAGADLIATTLAGYTAYSRQLSGPDFRLIEELVKAVHVPIIAEGRIWTPEEAKQALTLGAHAVVVGSAITRPQLITARFAEALRSR